VPDVDVPTISGPAAVSVMRGRDSRFCAVSIVTVSFAGMDDELGESYEMESVVRIAEIFASQEKAALKRLVRSPNDSYAELELTDSQRFLHESRLPDPEFPDL